MHAIDLPDSEDDSFEEQSREPAVRLRGGASTDCPRKGDGKRKGGDSDIGHVQCSDDCEQCASHGAGGSRNEGKEGGRVPKRRGWRVDKEGGPPITSDAGKVLARLLGIFTRAGHEDLEDLLKGLETSTLVPATDLAGAVARVKQLDVQGKHSDLLYMLALVQMTLHVDRQVPRFRPLATELTCILLVSGARPFFSIIPK